YQHLHSFPTRRSSDLNAVGNPEMLRDCGISAMVPWSAPRRRSLKTRMAKNELSATANCNVTGFSGVKLIPFNRFRSRSIVTLIRSEEHTSELQSRFDL